MLNEHVVLQVRSITKSFGSKKVHQGVTFDLHKGEILGLLGGSGTGKSVLLRSIIGLEKPDSGQILFENEDILPLNELQLVPIRNKIGYVFQNGALFDSLSVQDNLAYPLREHTQLSDTQILAKVNEMLKRVDMEGSNKLFPSELSGGMQKRAGLARAVILEPRIILFDEPTAGLDPVNTKRLIHNIQRLKTLGITGIFVTHDIPAAFEICDRIAILSQGKIAIIDTIDNIRNSNDDLVQSFISGNLGLTYERK
jgi:phospholipid/cholesterol/gamma-HCH transport system ATP-binding protein